MFLNSGVVRGLSFLAQLVLASLLSKHDFGVYAAAMAVAAFLTAFRDGGMAQWLTQGGRSEFDRRAGDAFWTGVVFNTSLGIALAAMAVPASSFFGEDSIAAVILVAGVSFPLTSLGSFYRTSLTIDLRMREVTAIEVASAVVKYALIVALALQGWGPLSFVLPLPIAYLLEAILGFAATRDRPWKRKSAARRWPGLLARNRWILSGTFIATVALQVDYAIIGRLATLPVLGVYYFAYQLTYMSASVVTENAKRVLFPGLVAAEPSKRGAATLKASSVATMLGAPLLLLPAAVIGPLEQLLWSGKWEQAVLPMAVLSLGLPLHLMTAVTQASLLSRGKFRLWSGVNGVRAIAVATGAALGAASNPDSALWISASVAAALVTANLVQVVLTYHLSQVALARVIAASTAPVLITPTCLMAVVVIFDSVSLHSFVQVATQALSFLGLWFAASLLLARSQLRESITFVYGALKRSAD